MIKQKSKVGFPHIVLLMSIFILVACAMTYLIPAGVYDTLENGAVDADSFHFIENTPVNPLRAFISVQSNMAAGGLVMSLLLILGAATEMLISCGAINSLVDTGIRRFKDDSIKVLVPMIYLLMSILGALCGNDSMLAYVAIGIIVAKKLQLDRICAVALFYLPYITAQAAGPTTVIIFTAQDILGIPPLSGAPLRLVVELCFYLAGASYVTWYALRVNNDPTRSIIGEGVLSVTAEEKAADDAKLNAGKFEPRALFSVISVILGYSIYAYGASTWGWSWAELCFCILASSVFIGILYKMNPNQIVRALYKGAGNMGAICFLMGFSRTISYVLTQGNVIHTISYYAVDLFSNFGTVGSALGLFVFNLLFNFIVVGGTTQAMIILPITMPMAELLGISKEVLSLTLQFGDGLTNCMTPLSGPLMGSLALGGVAYPQWIKFVFKIVLVNVCIAALAIVFAVTMGM